MSVVDDQEFVSVNTEKIKTLRQRVGGVENMFPIQKTAIARDAVTRCNAKLDQVEDLLPFCGEGTNIKPNDAFREVFFKYGLSTAVGVRAYIVCKTMDVERHIELIEELAKIVAGLQELTEKRSR